MGQNPSGASMRLIRLPARFAMISVVLCALSGCGDSEKQLQYNPDPKKRAQAAEELASNLLYSKGTVGRALKRALSDRDRLVRIRAAKLLLLSTSSEADLALKELNAAAAHSAAAALFAASERIHGTDVSNVRRLASMLTDPNVSIRRNAAEQLGASGLEPSGAIASLKKAAVDVSSEVRAAALHSLGQWGALATSALPEVYVALRQSCMDSEPSVLSLIAAYDKNDYPIDMDDVEGNDLRRDIHYALLDSARASRADTSQHLCLELLKDAFEIPLFDQDTFHIRGNCFAMEWQGAPHSSEEYRFEIERVVRFLEDEDRYGQLCNAAAIKRLAKRTDETK